MKEIIILVVSLIMLIIILPIVCVYMVLKRLINGNGKMIKVWSWKVSRAIDVFANIHGSEIFNDLLIKKGGYKFGNPQETISSVLGKNQVEETLTILGNIIRAMLDIIEYGHCILSINNELTNTRK
tara:strand:+ start:873 stop:1250 length:378 start_codon:yes stop_codon:yes gene_type:complete